MKLFYFLRYTVYICGLLFAAVHCAEAQESLGEEPRYSYLGVFGGYGYIMNSTALKVLPGSGDCGSFSNGKSGGLFAGILYDYTIFPQLLQLSGRLYFASRPADLTAQTSAYQVYDPINNRYSPLIQEFSFQSTLNYLVFDIGAKVFPASDMPIYFRTAFDAGNPVFGNNYKQYEMLALPESVLFPDGTRKRLMFSGELRDAATSLGLSVGLGADIEFQPRWFISPEVSYRHGLGSILREGEWNMKIIQAGVGVKYEFGHQPAAVPPSDTIIPPPPPPPPPQPVAPPVAMQSVASQTLEAQETVVTQTYPLLPYIFFDSSRAELRERYHPAVNSDFNENSLPREMLPTYYNVLNILGKRLLQNPDMNIILTGTTDGREAATSTLRAKLARERAEATADYLQSKWNIPKERMIIQTRDIPAIPSNDRYVEGVEENRRVEISSKDEKLLEPVVHTKFLEFSPTITRQALKTSVQYPVPSVSWTAELTLGGVLLGSLRGNGVPPDTLFVSVDAPALTKAAGLTAKNDLINGILRVAFSDGTSSEAMARFPLKRSMNQMEVSRLSLIVFDFNRSDISAQNREMMRSFVARSSDASSRASIVGSTDRLGEKQYNLELSQTRADAARELLRQYQPNLNVESSKGIGSSALPFDNNLPEGRYYCRTVSIEIITPLPQTEK